MMKPDDSFPKRCCGHTKIYVSRFGMGLLIVIGYFSISQAIQKTLETCLPSHPLAQVIALWVIAGVAIALAAILTTPLDHVLHSSLSPTTPASGGSSHYPMHTIGIESAMSRLPPTLTGRRSYDNAAMQNGQSYHVHAIV
jgi:hypothetical protein